MLENVDDEKLDTYVQTVRDYTDYIETGVLKNGADQG